jgi:hypothetical protein
LVRARPSCVVRARPSCAATATDTDTDTAARRGVPDRKQRRRLRPVSRGSHPTGLVGARARAMAQRGSRAGEVVNHPTLRYACGHPPIAVGSFPTRASPLDSPRRSVTSRLLIGVRTSVTP